VPTAVAGLTPNTRTSSGVINEPPTTPVHADDEPDHKAGTVVRELHVLLRLCPVGGYAHNRARTAENVAQS